MSYENSPDRSGLFSYVQRDHQRHRQQTTNDHIDKNGIDNDSIGKPL